MFIDFFYMLRQRGLPVSFNEWMTLMEGLEKGLAGQSLLDFYYLSRAVLIKTETDYDAFDEVFLAYFDGIKSIDSIPEEFYQWLHDPKERRPYDKNEVDARTQFDLEKLRETLEDRLQRQKKRHDGGQIWVGTGGTSVLGHSGYAKTGIKVGDGGAHGNALQIAKERQFRDFRDDNTLGLRSFQMAFRKLRQQMVKQDGPKDQLNLEQSIEETANNAGYLKLHFERPRENDIKVLLLFDSGGSMASFSKLTSQLFQAVAGANHFKDLQAYYFHNCIYDTVYRTPRLDLDEEVDTTYLLQQFGREYKVIFVGDASMSPTELFSRGGSISYYKFNQESGVTWLSRIKKHFDKVVWFNPIEKQRWPYQYGAVTIEAISGIIPMYHLSAEGLEEGLKDLVSAR